MDKDNKMRKILVTGGAGFIGTNLVLNLLMDGENKVVILDNLSRKGTEKNLELLFSRGFKNLQFVRGDIRDYRLVKKLTEKTNAIFHLAAQVAVTTSVEYPLDDFEVNALGTLYLLESCRKNAKNALFLYASTNKVYGSLSHLKLRSFKTRYMLLDRANGIDENEPLDFFSPYGCSKGAGDQYVRDYSRIYQMKTVVFRQSCIYGQYQHGNVDQGWVVHFIKKAMKGEKITIYGDGKQVRDILHVNDLIDAYVRVLNNKNKAAGKVFNIGGGIKNTFSLLELINYLERLLGREIKYEFGCWRPGDQKVFISNNRLFERTTGWKPRIGKEKGIRMLVEWLSKEA
ncbi:MAG: GDP-mannose 4,6-dehydratase [Candidatus Omnitrophica bacterium]|nr:GDP-mannose 4,6-dehydratase [Candidatus Omnitrophota bacterium]MCM8824880.1 GDP-mannose 4,6-dehydratase [Candidatus Omnitrophota bacterium]